jgi:hypothetical protein
MLMKNRDKMGIWKHIFKQNLSFFFSFRVRVIVTEGIVKNEKKRSEKWKWENILRGSGNLWGQSRVHSLHTNKQPSNRTIF